MITTIFLSLIISFITTIFSFFPLVTTLPSIAGADIDGTLVSYVGMVYHVGDVIWPIGVVFQGWAVLLAYYGIKMLAKLFLGPRAPGTHS